MPKIIGVDCDEVLSDTMEQFLKMPFFTSRNFQREKMVSYNQREIPEFWLTREESVELWRELFLSSHFQEIQPILWAKEKLQLWKEQGHTLIVITGRSLDIKEKTIERITQYYPDLFDDFLFSSVNLPNEVSKSELCRQAWIQVVVEDNLDFVADISQHWVPCFLLDEPRNKIYISEKYPNVIKVNSRNDIDLSLLP